MTAVSYKVVHTEPVPPRKLNPSIPLKLESIILKCLAKNPDERYQTGEDLARDLGELRSVSTAVGLKSAPPKRCPREAIRTPRSSKSLPWPSPTRTAAAPPAERAAPPKTQFE